MHNADTTHLYVLICTTKTHLSCNESPSQASLPFPRLVYKPQLPCCGDRAGTWEQGRDEIRSTIWDTRVWVNI